MGIMEANPQPGRIYSGVIPRSESGIIVVQLRDSGKDIANSDRITTFGGSADSISESPRDVAVREAHEELGLLTSTEALEPLCVIDKTEEDGSPTRCFYYLVEDVDLAELRLNEGAAIISGSPDEIVLDARLTTTCRSAIEQLGLRDQARQDGALGTLEVTAAISDAAHPVNEDLWRISANCGWLLDGASPLGTEPAIHAISDARGYVELLDRALVSLQARYKQGPLVVWLEAAISEVSAELNKLGYTAASPPSAAGAIVRLTSQTVEYCVMADVTVVVQRELGDPFVLVDDRVSGAREEYLLHLERSQGGNAVVHSTLERRRTQMNRPGGYWVLADSALAIQYARTGYVRLPDSRSRVIMSSDGFSRAVTPYGLSDWRTLLDMNDIELEQILRTFRDLERDDVERLAFPRVSGSDDATIVSLVAPQTKNGLVG